MVLIMSIKIDYSKHNTPSIRWVADPTGFGFGHWETTDYKPESKKLDEKQVNKILNILKQKVK